MLTCSLLILVRARRPPSAYKFLADNEIGNARGRFVDKRPEVAPSDVSKPAEFKKLQVEELLIPCGRPFESKPRPPVTLLYEGFGQFIDDAANLELTNEVLEFTLDFRREMSNFFDIEKGRQAAAKKVFERFGIHLHSVKVRNTRYSSDSAVVCGPFYMIVVEFKNELASGGGPEAVLQAIMYYFELTREQALLYLFSTLPCLLVMIVGTPNVIFIRSFLTVYWQVHWSRLLVLFGLIGRTSTS